MTDRINVADIGEVMEVTVEFQPEVTKVNRYLGLGWVLLNTYPVGDAHEGQMMRYCLGWPRTKGKVLHPATPSSDPRYVRPDEI